MPLNSQAAEALSAYLENGRESLLPNRAETTVFVNQRGAPLTPHTLRHSCAAHRLAQGTNVQRVRELLGHANVSTTQVYKDTFSPPNEEFDVKVS